MKFRILFFLAFLNLYVSAQDIRMCAYRDYLTEDDIKNACGNNSYLNNQKAEEVVDNILKNVGLFRNFIIKECPNISNAVAATVKSTFGSFDRYIIYDKDFLDRVSGVTGTDWGAISIMAHEIGHHLNGHTLISGMDNHQSELQADEFSGFVLSKMGATLEESLIAMKKYGGTYASISHPDKITRIKAIKSGWEKGNGSLRNININNRLSFELLEYDSKQLDYFVKKGNDAFVSKDYKKASSYFFKAFQYSAGIDVIYLYYAASASVTARDYDTALNYYLVLQNRGYSGDEINYFATNRKSKIVESFSDKNARDFAIKHKTHKKPYNERSPSKTAEIVKNIALIYVSQGENEKALGAMADAREENPDDIGLLLSEANIYLKMGNREKFKDLMEEATQKDPKNAELQYNLGVLAAEGGNAKAAIEYYEKAVAINPNYVDAYTNIAVVILDGEAKIVEEMNALGTSKADNIKYDELKEKRTQVYEKAIPYLEKALELKNTNVDAARTLMNIYSALGETDKFKTMRAKVEAMEASANGN